MNPDEPNKLKAVIELVGGNISGAIDGSELHFWSGQTPPTEEEIDTKLAEMVAEWDAQEYARNRQAEYPSLLELTVALYDTDDKSAVEAKRAAVKLKYPKPS
jgi:hypothetical protein